MHTFSKMIQNAHQKKSSNKINPKINVHKIRSKKLTNKAMKQIIDFFQTRINEFEKQINMYQKLIYECEEQIKKTKLLIIK